MSNNYYNFSTPAVMPHVVYTRDESGWHYVVTAVDPVNGTITIASSPPAPTPQTHNEHGEICP